jgi:hypothetical protein
MPCAAQLREEADHDVKRRRVLHEVMADGVRIPRARGGTAAFSVPVSQSVGTLGNAYRLPTVGKGREGLPSSPADADR